MKVISVKLTIGMKILAGFIPLIGLIFLIAVITLIRLDEVNSINKEIVSVDMAVEKASDKMVDVLLAQESYGQRYLILKNNEILSLFRVRDEEFNSIHESVASFQKQYPALEIAASYHKRYVDSYENVFEMIDNSEKFPPKNDSIIKTSLNRQIEILKDIRDESRQNQSNKMKMISEIVISTYRTVAILTSVGIISIIIVTYLISRNILNSIGTLKAAANMVSLGTFIHLPKVKSKDELGDLSVSFNEMAERLMKIEEAYKDASPLTGLPGGIAIENMVKQRIERNEPFAFCMIDLDNFKPFNDRYGYARGNAVIKMTAEIIQSATKELGNETDFVGHIGGDDFALIACPEKFEKACNRIIEEFDRRIVEHYDEEDLKKGCIVSVNRQGVKLSFPIMTISIAAVNSLKSKVNNYIEVGEIVAELKKYAKQFSVSNLVIDRRGGRKKERYEIKQEQFVST